MTNTSTVSGGMPFLDVSALLEMMRDVPKAPPDPLARVVLIRCHRGLYDQLKALCKDYLSQPYNRSRPGISVEVAPLCLPGMALGFAANNECVLFIGPKPKPKPEPVKIAGVNMDVN